MIFKKSIMRCSHRYWYDVIDRWTFEERDSYHIYFSTGNTLLPNIRVRDTKFCEGALKICL